MDSQKSTAPSEVTAKQPKRSRGEARVATLLTAAAEVFSEKGFDGATMSEIAARAHAPIGSLYQFFPNKDLISNALLAQGSEQLSEMLEGLQPLVAGMSGPDLADLLFARLTRALDDLPAFVALTDGRAEAPHKQTMREKMRGQIATLFENVTPPLPAGKPAVIAALALQMMKMAVVLMREPDAALRVGSLEELRAMLKNHLAQISLPPA